MSWFDDRAGSRLLMLDPWRTLELRPGAGETEIKRAYRRLVKEHHPDSAGPAALQRFLAIQAAYEMLLEGRGGGAPSATAARGPERPTEPWRADPARARATREGWRRAGRRGSAGGWGARPAGGPFGERGDGGRASPVDGAGERDEDGNESVGRETGGGATGSGETGRHEAGGAAGAREHAAGQRASFSAGAAGKPHGTDPGRDRGRHRHHRPRKATPGSTTYDEALRDPEPGWTGSAWYGQTSGTYWTINPREYADPRKHGPEYQARARRAVSGDAPGRDDAGRAGTAEPQGGPAERQGGPAAQHGGPAEQRGDPAEQQDGPAGHERASGDPARARRQNHRQDEAPAPSRAREIRSGRPIAHSHDPISTPGDRRPPGSAIDSGMDSARGSGLRPGSAASSPGPSGQLPAGRPNPAAALGANTWSVAGGPRPRDEAAGPLAFRGLGDLIDVLPHSLSAPRRRLLLALVGWPPLGIAAALILGEVTGCARFAATCGSATAFSGWTVLLQLLIIGALALLPRVARLASFGSIAVLLAAIPVVAFLTAVGATYAPRGGPEALLGLLGISWIAGLLLGWRAMRTQTGSSSGQPVA